jgi:hypothetical protein
MRLPMVAALVPKISRMVRGISLLAGRREGEHCSEGTTSLR